MLSWLFKKRGAVAAPAVPDSPAPAARRAPTRPDASAVVLDATAVQAARSAWLEQLQAAQGDDASLLRLACATPLLEMKIAAVEALASEDALRQAEREFRSHDRKVHRIAKQRLEAAVSGRVARVTAQTLLARTTALIEQELVPVNHLIALDREWGALPATLLEPDQCARFTELRARLDTVMRERADAQQHQQRTQRETAEAERARREAAAAQAAMAAEIVAATATVVAAPPPPPPAPVAAWSPEQHAHIEALLQQAEAALADGQLGAMLLHLSAIDAFLATPGAALPPEALRARHQALRMERERLHGWQKWGGARAREDLSAEAEALAASAKAAADPEVPDRPKLSLKTHAESLHVLRLRWKELDRLDAPASQALWQRFDSAVRVAFEPVAAQHAAMKTARQENLRAREAMLVTLEALPVPEASAHAGEAAAPWRDAQRELERFQLAWRKLGPLEHTVPSRARDALQQRLRAALDRVDLPLHEARGTAAARREQLIARAQALVSADGGYSRGADPRRQVRDLQAEWQDQARQLPLPRALETSLWARFRAATDAVFAQRDAAHAEREAESAAVLAEREALLTRLSALHADTPAADIERALADTDRAWRQAGELPRGAGEAIEARFRAARAAAVQRVATSASRAWQARCDALLARLALCEAREAGGADAADLDARWGVPDALPAEWAQPLAQRWSCPVEPGPLGAADIDDLLIRSEAALDLPAAPEWQDARRNLKLRALKDSLEGRAVPKSGPAEQAGWMQSLLRQRGLAPAQRERLQALLAALRAAGPHHFGLTFRLGR